MATAIQFLRSDTPELRPNPVSLADGMPMLNSNETEPGLFFKARNGSLFKVGPVAVGQQAPNSNSQGYEGNCIGECWLDTSGTGSPRFRVWDGSVWTTDADVTVDEDQTITGQKTFTQPVIAQGGVEAVGQPIQAESLTLSGTASSISTQSSMEPTTLTTKGYVDALSQTATLAFEIIPGDYIQGIAFDGSTEATWNVRGASTNSANALVARDATGSFTASTIKATLDGVAADCSRSVLSGNGLSGGGALNQDLTLSVTAADDTLLTSELGVRVNEASTTIAFWLPNTVGAHYSGGSVGIGVTTPAATLDVGGHMKLEDLTSDPAGGEAGMIACVNGELKFHNGTAWVTVTTS